MSIKLAAEGSSLEFCDYCGLSDSVNDSDKKLCRAYRMGDSNGLVFACEACIERKRLP
jgi:hypothetical protein